MMPNILTPDRAGRCQCGVGYTAKDASVVRIAGRWLCMACARNLAETARRPELRSAAARIVAERRDVLRAIRDEMEAFFAKDDEVEAVVNADAIAVKVR